MKQNAFLLLASLAVAASACGDDDHGDHGSSGGGGNATACEKDTRKDLYTAGLSKQAGDLTVKIMDATPAPPTKGTNAMTLEIADAAGPVAGATVNVLPFMPDHGHGSAVTPVVTDMGGGKYKVEKVYLAMAGLWRITVSVQKPGAAAQEVAFAFCLEG